MRMSHSTNEYLTNKAHDSATYDHTNNQLGYITQHSQCAEDYSCGFINSKSVVYQSLDILI